MDCHRRLWGLLSLGYWQDADGEPDNPLLTSHTRPHALAEAFPGRAPACSFRSATLSWPTGWLAAAGALLSQGINLPPSSCSGPQKDGNPKEKAENESKWGTFFRQRGRPTAWQALRLAPLRDKDCWARGGAREVGFSFLIFLNLIRLLQSVGHRHTQNDFWPKAIHGPIFKNGCSYESVFMNIR